MIAHRLLATFTCLAALATALPPRSPAQEKQPAAKDAKQEEVSFSKQIAPLLTKYCTGCHGGEKPKGKMGLDRFLDNPEPLKHREMWDLVVQRVRGKEMPPKDKPQPTAAEIDTIARWVDRKSTRLNSSHRL